MSLPSLMRLLGHTDYRMTLRYTAIADSTVAAEFAQALQRNAERYPSVIRATPPSSSTPDPMKTLSDVAKYVQKRTEDDALDRQTGRALVRRLRRLRADLRQFLTQAQR